jgi:hypothetical protein
LDLVFLPTSILAITIELGRLQQCSLSQEVYGEIKQTLLIVIVFGYLTMPLVLAINWKTVNDCQKRYKRG